MVAWPRLSSKETICGTGGLHSSTPDVQAVRSCGNRECLQHPHHHLWHKFGPVQVTNVVWVKQIYQLTRVVENCPFDNQPIHFNNRFPFMHGGSTNVTIGVVATIVLLLELQRQGSAGHEATDRLRELTGNGDGL